MRYKQSVRFQEEDYDGRGSMYLPHCGGQGVASVLRYCRLNIKDKYEKQGRTLSGLSAVQGTATAS